ncbi:MAG: hypothetical protein WC517_03645 [Patescibacteria group bacterium]
MTKKTVGKKKSGKEKPLVKPAAKKPRPVKPPQKWALLSVFCKKNIVPFAQALIALDYKIVSSGGTAKHLAAAGIAVTDVAKITGYPPILGHRVVTLHPKIHGGILAKLEHEAELRQLRMHRFSLVCVDLYPVWEALTDPNATISQVAEFTDIGGPTMIRGAAKNFENGVTVICDPADRTRVIIQLCEQDEVSSELRQELASKVFNLMARYDAAIYHFLAKDDPQRTIFSAMQPVSMMRKGESDIQSPAFLCRDLMAADHPLAWPNWEKVASNPGYVNLCGGDRTLWLMCRLIETFRRNFNGKVPHIAIACKHGNPCGLGVDWDDPCVALKKAMRGDPDAVMGSEVMVNFLITSEAAIWLNTVPEELRSKVGRSSWGPDVIFAPSFADSAKNLLTSRKQSRVLLANQLLYNPGWPLRKLVVRPVLGGALVQPAPNFVLEPAIIDECVGFGWEALTVEEKTNLIIAWSVAWEGVSNSATLVNDQMLLSAGLGQQARHTAFWLTIERAKMADHQDLLAGSSAGSDGFFPFAQSKPGSKSLEATEMLQRIGCRSVVVPADGERWQEVRQFLLDSGIKVVAVNRKSRGFSQH